MTNYTKVKQAEKEIQKQSFESVVVFDNNGNFLAWKDGETLKVNLTEEVQKGYLKNTVLTHNHPTKYVASFSHNDIKLFLDGELLEIRAIDYKYVYSLSLKKEKSNKTWDQLQSEVVKIEKELNNILKQAIINDTECFEDYRHETWSKLFKGSRTFKYTRTVA